MQKRPMLLLHNIGLGVAVLSMFRRGNAFPASIAGFSDFVNMIFYALIHILYIYSIYANCINDIENRKALYMPIIALCSSKGGVGKTTTSLALALGLARGGHSVCLLEADPNAPLAQWLANAGEQENLALHSGLTEMSIVKAVKKASEAYDYIIIDTEGSGNAATGKAVAMSDLCLLPLSGTRLEAEQVIKTIGLIEDTEIMQKRQIPFRIIFVRTGNFATKEFKFIAQSFAAAGWPVMEQGLKERAAYTAMFQYSVSLFALNNIDVAKADAAKAEATAFAAAVKKICEE